jgi:hypothetical protein
MKHIENMEIPNILSMQSLLVGHIWEARKESDTRNLIKPSLTSISLHNGSTFYWRVNFDEIIIGFWIAFFQCVTSSLN